MIKPRKSSKDCFQIPNANNQQLLLVFPRKLHTLTQNQHLFLRYNLVLLDYPYIIAYIIREHNTHKNDTALFVENTLNHKDQLVNHLDKETNLVLKGSIRQQNQKYNKYN